MKKRNEKTYLVDESSLESKPKIKKKRTFPFSKAIFFESLKGNWKTLLSVGAANGLLMIIIVGILSTLNINATSQSMKNLFDSAGTETTVKSGAISYYQAFDTVSEGYDTLDSTINTLSASLERALEMVNDSSLENQMSRLRLLYNGTYSLTSGDEATKKETAKSTAISSGVALIEANSSYSKEEKEVASLMIRKYFEVYAEDTSISHKTIMTDIMPKVIKEYIGSRFALKDEDVTKVSSIIDNAFDSYLNKGNQAKYVAVETTLKLCESLISYVSEVSFAPLFDNVLDVYESDKEKFVTDLDYRSSVYSDSITSLFFNTLEDTAYYSYLPTFTVNYKTSELGWPIAYIGTGEYNDDGSEKFKVVEIKSYHPERFEEVEGGLGTPATIVQKMHKEALTGTSYTNEEIVKAKDAASKDINLIKDDVKDFMGVYINRNDTNPYYHDGARDEDAIEEYAIDTVISLAKEEFLKTFNEKYGTSYTDVLEIDGKEGGLSGQVISDTIMSYANSGVSTYKKAYKEKLKAGYGQKDAMLVATVIAGRGIMDQLPTAVNDSLTELGGMNTYGIITGKVGFAIACLLIPMVYSVMLATSLVSQKVENGSLAFTFSTPITRNAFIVTEGTFLIFAQVVMGAILYLGSLIARIIGIIAGSPDIATSLPLDQFTYYALGNFFVTLGVSGVAFLASAYFNKSGLSLGVGGGFVVFSFLCSILGLFGSPAIPGTVRINSMNFFNYLTPISFFDPLAIMDGNIALYWYKLIGLFALTILGYGLGNFLFKKKDLPL